ncbi:hypothetical protein LDENG_00026090 [Lucifuga dentata]|nr:hypothetical protein LDENG_00026090 [Lucifuga dentata]
MYFVTSYISPLPSPILCFLLRFLSDRLGVLLHGCRGGGGHAAVHLAFLFCGEEAEAVSVLETWTGGDLRWGDKWRGLHSVDSHQYSTAGTKDPESFWCSGHHGTRLT